MSKKMESIRIPMQVGAELRIKNSGQIVVGNPEVELANSPSAAGAVLLYTFSPDTDEHILRLLDPVADHEHVGRHHRDD